MMKDDFMFGELPRVSYVRPDKLFTTDKSLVIRGVGRLKKEIRQKILRKVGKLFNEVK